MALALIIEDDPSVKENLEEILNFKGFHVIAASEGKMGLELAIAKEPDLIISDIMMPEMDGYTLVKEVRGNARISNTPVILLTAKTLAESKIKGLEIGADDYITKPFNAKELVARVYNLIDIRKRIKAKALLESEKREVESTESVFMRELMDLFSENLENSHYAIEDIVVSLGLSKSTIQRRVKTITDKTFNQLLREYRLEQAKQLLEQRGGNISEVAYSVGFNSVSYFSFSFKKYFGYPPTEIVGKPE